VEQSEVLRADGYKRHGTTIEWLVKEKGFTAFWDYYVWCHPENEADCLLPDPELRQFIEKLPCSSSILTNSPGFHAQRVIKKLGFEGLFERVFDIESNEHKGKPHASAYQRVLKTLGFKPEETLFIDDFPVYVEGYLAIGGKGLLLDELGRYPDYPHERIKDLREIMFYLA
jgi:putative hydrolase of the HAD superfamily